ncbi:WXG100-like domain-containing protein [Nocardia gipuzkoensis]
MSLHWPPELRWLTYVVGQLWPDGDEDQMFAMAQAWLDAADDLEREVIPLLSSAAATALGGYEAGAGRSQIESALRELYTGDHSVEQLVSDYRQLGKSTRNAATTLEATKLIIIFSTTILAAQIAGAWLFPPTAPAVEAAAIGAARAGLYRVSNQALGALARLPGVGEYLVKFLRYLPRLSDEPGRIAGLIAKPPTALAAKATPGLFDTFVNAGFKATTARTLAELPADAAQFLISKAVNNVIWAGGMDVMVQYIQIGKGHRDEFDGKQFGMSVAASIGGWYAGALVATNLTKYGGRWLTSRGHDPTAGGWGAALGVTCGVVPTITSSLVGGGISYAFTGSFDPTMGLIGAVASNSLMGGQRGYIGMLGTEPVATRKSTGGDPEATIALRTIRDVDAPRPTKSTEELINQLRSADDHGYRQARQQDSAAGGRGADGAPVDRRFHRDAYLTQQRTRINELVDAHRDVLTAQLDLARARAAPPDVDTDANVAQAQRRLDEAVARDSATRGRIEHDIDPGKQVVRANDSQAHERAVTGGNDLPRERRSLSDEESNHRRSMSEEPNPRRRSQQVDIEPPSQQRSRGVDDEPPAGQRPRSEIESVRTRRSTPDDNASTHSERSRSVSPENVVPQPGPLAPAQSSTVLPLRRVNSGDSTTSSTSSSSTASFHTARSRWLDDDEQPAPPQHNQENLDNSAPSNTNNQDSQPSTTHHSVDELGASVTTTNHDAVAPTVHDEITVDPHSTRSLPTSHRDDHESDNRSRPTTLDDGNTTTPPPRRIADVLDTAPGSSARDRLATAESRMQRLRAADDQVRTAHERANAKGLDNALRARAEIRATLSRQEAELGAGPTGNSQRTEAELRGDIADQRARLAVADADIARRTAGLDAAFRARAQAKAELDTSLTELTTTRATATDHEAHQDGPPPPRPDIDVTARADHLTEELTALDAANTRRELDSGFPERHAQRQLDDFDASQRAERTLIDGGYMSGKPRSRKLPLEHGMPDPFTALTAPGVGFWQGQVRPPVPDR